MNFYVEYVDSSNPKLIDANTYNYMIDEFGKTTDQAGQDYPTWSLGSLSV